MSSNLQAEIIHIKIVLRYCLCTTSNEKHKCMIQCSLPHHCCKSGVTVAMHHRLSGLYIYDLWAQ